MTTALLLKFWREAVIGVLCFFILGQYACIKIKSAENEKMKVNVSRWEEAVNVSERNFSECEKQLNSLQEAVVILKEQSEILGNNLRYSGRHNEELMAKLVLLEQQRISNAERISDSLEGKSQAEVCDRWMRYIASGGE